MIGSRIEITISVRTQSPLHIGTGESMVMDGVGTNDTQVSVCAVGPDGNPVLPGPGTRGSLRTALAEKSARMTDLLFGPRSITDPTSAKAGLLAIWNGTFKPEDSATVKGPYSNCTIHGRNKPLGEYGMFVDARTAINPSSGTADEGKLFYQLMVAEGCSFTLRMSLLLRNTGHTIQKELLEESQYSVQTLLAILCSRGISLGGGKGYGHGKAMGDLGTLSIVKYEIGMDGTLSGADISEAWKAAIAEQINVSDQLTSDSTCIKMRLQCEGLYLTQDSASHSQSDQRTDDDESEPGRDNLIHALRNPLNTDEPRLSGPSVYGALRARGVWLQRIGSIHSPESRDYRDNRDLIYGKSTMPPESEEARKTANSPSELSSSELLFGVNGWRGLLNIRDIRFEAHKGWQDVHSVTIDRFGGGFVRGGLFKTRASIMPIYSLALQLDAARMNRLDAGDKDRAQTLFEQLIEDINLNGIEFGHGSNKGYGWFRSI